MFESVVADVLNRYLGAYVRDFNREQLRVAVWSGNVELHDLILRRDALDMLDLPVEVERGSIGKLVLQIPWSSLQSSPLIVELHDLNILVRRHDLVDIDDHDSRMAAKEAATQRVKQAKLAALEERRIGKQDTVTTSKSSSFVHGLVSRIVNNIQLSIHNVHICYMEDPLAMYPGVSVGITVTSVSAVSTDASWEPSFRSERYGTAFKLLDLQNLSLYWNAAGDDILPFPDTETQRLMLGPICALGKLKIKRQRKNIDAVTADDSNTSDQGDDGDARVVFDIGLKSIPIVVSKCQYASCVAVLDGFARSKLGEQFRGKRPRNVAICDAPRLWWGFAIECIRKLVREKRMRFSWEYLSSRRDARNQYVQLYVEKLTSVNSTLEGTGLTHLETALHYEDIRLFRWLAHRRVARDSSLRAQAVAATASSVAIVKTSWTSWLWSSRDRVISDTVSVCTAVVSNVTDNVDETMSSKLTDEEHTELLRIINHDRMDDDDDNDGEEGNKFITKVTFRLDQGSIRLVEGAADTSVVILRFDSLKVDTMRWPLRYATCFAAQLGGVELLDLSLPLSPMASVIQGGGFEFVHETNPIDSSCDTRIHIRTQPMECVLSHHSVSTLWSFFTYKADSFLALEASNRLHAVRKTTQEGFAFALYDKRVVDVVFDIQAPVILVPDHFPIDSNDAVSVLVLDLGHIMLNTVVQPRRHKRNRSGTSNALSEEFEDDDFVTPPSTPSMRKSYFGDVGTSCAAGTVPCDIYALEMANLQVLVSLPYEEWRNVLAAERCEGRMIEPFTVAFTLEKRMNEQSDETLACFVVVGQIDELAINCSEQRLQCFSRSMNEFYSIVSGSLRHDKSDSLYSTELMSSVLESADGMNISVLSHRESGDDEIFLSSCGFEDEFSNTSECEAMLIDCNDEINVIDYDLLTVSFEVRHLKLRFSVLDGTRDIGELRVRGVKHLFVRRCFCTHSSFFVNSLDMLDGESLYLLRSGLPCDSSIDTDVIHKSLVCIEYFSISRGSPHFYTNHSGVDVTITATFDSLYIYANNKSVLQLLQFVHATWDSDDGNVQLSHLIPLAGHGAVSSSAISSPVVATQELSVQCRRLTVSFKLLSVTLVEVGVPLSLVEASGMELDISSNETNSVTRGRLGKLTMRDLSSEHGLYEDVLGTSGEEVLDFVLMIPRQLQSFSKNVESSDMEILTKNVASFRLRMSTVYLNYTRRFFTLLTEYFTGLRGSISTSISDGMAEAAWRATTHDRTTERLSMSTLFHFNIDVQSPVIIVPRSSHSEHVLVANLGRITLKNEFVTFPAGVCDNIRLNLDDMRLYLAVIGSLSERQIVILDSASVSLTFERPLHEIDPLDASLRISTDISPIQLTLSKFAYLHLLGTVEENLGITTNVPADESPRSSNTLISPSLSIASGKSSSHPIAVRLKLAQVQLLLTSGTPASAVAVALVRLDELNLDVVSSQVYFSADVTLRAVHVADQLHHGVSCPPIIRSGSSGNTAGAIDDEVRTLVSVKYRHYDCSSMSSLPNDTQMTVEESLAKFTSLGQSFSVADTSGEAPSSFDDVEQSNEAMFIGTFVDVQFDALHVVIVPETWVFIFDFFVDADAAASTKLTPHQTCSPSCSTHDNSSTLIEAVNRPYSFNISVNELSVTLTTEPVVQFSRFAVTSLFLSARFTRNIREWRGRLGHIAVTDLTPNGRLRPTVFQTRGDAAVQLTYTEPVVTPLNHQQSIASVRLYISSVVVIYQHRFISELLQYRDDLNYLQVVFSAVHAVSGSDRHIASLNAPSSLLKLNIVAASPVVIVPLHSGSSELLVLCPGTLTLTNCFTEMYMADVVNSCKKYLVEVDRLCVTFTDMNVFSTTAEAGIAESDMKHGTQMLEECTLVLSVVRRLSPHVRDSSNGFVDSSVQLPDYLVAGTMSNMRVLFSESLYSLIIGILRENIGDNMQLDSVDSRTYQWSSINAAGDSDVRGDASSASIVVANIGLENVSLELLHDCSSPYYIARKEREAIFFALCRFTSSSLSIHRTSDSVLTLDFSCGHVEVVDSSPNASAFPCVLTPIENPSSLSPQLCFTYRYEPYSGAEVMNIILHETRLLFIYNWLLEVRRFIIPLSSSLASPTTKDVRESFAVSNSYSNRQRRTMVVHVSITTPELVFLNNCLNECSSALVLRGCCVMKYTWCSPNASLGDVAPESVQSDNSGATTTMSISLSQMEVFSTTMAGHGCRQRRSGTSLLPDAFNIFDPFALHFSYTYVEPSTIMNSSATKRTSISLDNLECRLTRSDFRLCQTVLFSDFPAFITGVMLTRVEDVFTNVTTQSVSSDMDETNMRKMEAGAQVLSGKTEFMNTFQSFDESALGMAREDIDSAIKTLCELGFNDEWCFKALLATLSKSNGIDAAAQWLFENAPSLVDEQSYNATHVGSEDTYIASPIKETLSFQASRASVIIIDDRNGLEVQLVDVIVKNVELEVRNISSNAKGVIMGSFGINYYNPRISAWEPILEPWQPLVNFKWQSVPYSYIFFSLTSEERLEASVTHAMLQFVWQPMLSWFIDDKSAISSNRSAFIPYQLINETGESLTFFLADSSANFSSDAITRCTSSIGANTLMTDDCKRQRLVGPGESVLFDFPGKRQPYRANYSQLIVVHVHGWSPAEPVRVDRVGNIIRYVVGESNVVLMKEGSVCASVIGYDEGYAMPNVAQLILDISLVEGRKVIVVRSGVQLCNRLMNIDLEYGVIVNRRKNNISQPDWVSPTLICAGSTVSLPLCLAFENVLVRPVGWGEYSWSTDSLSCGNTDDVPNTSMLSCSMASDTSAFLLYVKHEALNCSSKVFIFLPPLVIRNSLPCEMRWSILTEVDTQRFLHRRLGRGSKGGLIVLKRGCVNSGESIALHEVSMSDPLLLTVSLLSYAPGNPVLIHGGQKLKSGVAGGIDKLFLPSKLVLRDADDLPLKLNIHHQVHGTHAARFVSLFSPYWMVNRTGLPILYKVETLFGNQLAAGQQLKDEKSRSDTAPFPFSFDREGTESKCRIRLGNSNWSSAFGLENVGRAGKLSIRKDAAGKGKGPDADYDVGIMISKASGIFNRTTTIVLMPAIIITNRTEYPLEYIQYQLLCSVLSEGMTCSGNDRDRNNEMVLLNCSHPTVTAGAVKESLAPGQRRPFYWSCSDIDKLLSVRFSDDVMETNWLWSGGFQIEGSGESYVKLRPDRTTKVSNGNHMTLLRVEIELHHATHFVSFSLSETSIPPFCIENDSHVTLVYHQKGTYIREEIDADSVKDYAWDKLNTPSPLLVIQVAGTVGSEYAQELSLSHVDTCPCIYYPNPFHITIKNLKDGPPLVLEARDIPMSSSQYSGGRRLYKSLVLVSVKRTGMDVDSQLWLMNGDGVIRNKLKDKVLDVDGDQPVASATLILRSGNDNLKRWRFSKNRLVCSHGQNLVAEAGGGARPGAVVILAHPRCSDSSDHVVAEQDMNICKLLPGSGVLFARVIADGPTRVLRIVDWYNRDCTLDHGVLDLLPRKSSCQTSPVARQSFPNVHDDEILTCDIQIHLIKGFGISLVDAFPQELLYLNARNISLEYSSSNKFMSLELSVFYAQIDNQLKKHLESPVLLSPTFPPSDGRNRKQLPLFYMTLLKDKRAGDGAFKALNVLLQTITVRMDELLLLRLLDFVGLGENCDVDVDSEISMKIYAGDDTLHAHSSSTEEIVPRVKKEMEPRLYFEVFMIQPVHIYASFEASTDLPENMATLKEALGLTLLSIGESQFKLNALLLEDPWATRRMFFSMITSHYTQELLSQVYRAIGSVDFLGNPRGTLQNFSTGFYDFFYEPAQGLASSPKDFAEGLKKGSSSLVKHFTHGIANSTSKITAAVSTGLAEVTMDEEYQRERHRKKQRPPKDALEGLESGFIRFGKGIFGGITGVVTQPVRGAVEDGVEGFFKGMGRGIVGAVAKPVAGVFDLVSDGTAGLRSSTNVSGGSKIRTRLPRHIGVNGVLTAFSQRDANGRDVLDSLNNGDSNGEVYVAHIELGLSHVFAMVTSNRVVLFSKEVNSRKLKINTELNFALMKSFENMHDGIAFIMLTAVSGTLQSLIARSRNDVKRMPSVQRNNQDRWTYVARCSSIEIRDELMNHVRYAYGYYINSHGTQE